MLPSPEMKYTRYRLPESWSKDKHKLAFTVDDVCSASECAELLEQAEEAGWKASPMAPLQLGHRARVDDVAWAEKLFERLRPYCPPVHMRRRVSALTPTRVLSASLLVLVVAVLWSALWFFRS